MCAFARVCACMRVCVHMCMCECMYEAAATLTTQQYCSPPRETFPLFRPGRGRLPPRRPSSFPWQTPPSSFPLLPSSASSEMWGVSCWRHAPSACRTRAGREAPRHPAAPHTSPHTDEQGTRLPWLQILLSIAGCLCRDVCAGESVFPGCLTTEFQAHPGCARPGCNRFLRPLCSFAFPHSVPGVLSEPTSHFPLVPATRRSRPP
jgi:hypothetical protein